MFHNNFNAMRSIIIKEIHFVNFKGFRNMTIEFNEDITTICGRNGSGKTSIFDGFTWLLFGKDCQDRKAFNFKTLDENGKAIPKLPHEVSAIIVVDGETIELCRRFNEKWVKRRGEIEEEFTGHEEERLYNNVPMSLKEWNEKISNICSEQVFKFITNPKYFVSQKPGVQRAMLFRMAGELSDADIAAGNDDFSALLASLTGKTMEEYKKEIQAKKRRIKAGIEAIPERIDERKRDIASLSEYDYPSIEKSIEEKQERVSKIEAEMLDLSKQNEAVTKQRSEAIKELGKLKEKKLRLEYEIKEKVTADYRASISKKNEIQSKISELERNIRSLSSRKDSLKHTIEECSAYREKLIAEWKSVNASTITFNENDFVCPTCKRPLDIDDIEKKQQEMTENFNLNKSVRLTENNRKGQENKKKMQDAEEAISSIDGELQKASEEIETLKSSEDYTINLIEPDARPAIDSNDEYKELSDTIASKEKALEDSNDTNSIDFSAQKKELSTLKLEIDDLKATLSFRETIVRNTQRIGELEKQYKEGAQELAELERIEFTMAAFNKARIEAIDKRINGMFSLVKFKMYEQQINGGEIETCEAVVNGVPYSGQNNAMQINMGIDIINAICKFEGITAPIFIDNAESVNEFISSQSQVIKLVVTTDNELSIK
jgi:DNA repair exonuclease SbcCD ATPase subunit